MFKLVVVAAVFATVYCVKFEFQNLDTSDIWVGTLGNSGKEALEGGGFTLGPSESRIVTAPADWAGRFWARSAIEGKDGTAPTSLAEITLKGSGELDFYDISLVDGFNIPLSFGPVDGIGDGSQYSCQTATCAHHFSDDCPDALKVTNDSGDFIACVSACSAFLTDQYCCRGDYSTPDTCKSSEWPVDYPSYFKGWCPDAYSYAYDDNKSTYTCNAEKYIVTFGG